MSCGGPRDGRHRRQPWNLTRVALHHREPSMFIPANKFLRHSSQELHANSGAARFTCLQLIEARIADYIVMFSSVYGEQVSEREKLVSIPVHQPPPPSPVYTDPGHFN